MGRLLINLKSKVMKRYIVLLSLFIVALLAACSKMDEFTEHTDGKAIIYPAKLDSIRVRSGKIPYTSRRCL